MDINTDFNFLGASRITNLPPATAPGQPVIREQLDAAVEGLSWKDSARVSTQGNVSLASPGATIDGITMAANDRVLVRAQTAAAENGIYIWNGAAVAMTRAPDANTADELEQATVSVEEGTSASATFRQTAVNFTLGTGAVTFSSFGTAAPQASTTQPGVIQIGTQAEVDAGTASDRAVTPATLASWSGRARRASGVFGDGTATQFDIVHNLGTRRVSVTVRRTSGNYDRVMIEDRALDANTVRITCVSPPANGAYEATITA